MNREVSPKIILTEEQFRKLYTVMLRYNRLLGANLDTTGMFCRVMCLGLDKWFDERINALNLPLDIMEQSFGKKD